jgi:phage shock protein A
LSSALERVHLAEESNTSLRQSFEVLKTKIVILKTKLATAKAEEKDTRGGEEGNRELREETILLFHPT